MTKLTSEVVNINDLHLDIISSPDATIAILDGVIDGEAFRWVGTAKRFPGDKFIPAIGRKLAISRAFARAARQFEKQGNGLVKCMDHNREASARSREESKSQPEGVRVHRVRRTKQAR